MNAVKKTVNAEALLYEYRKAIWHLNDLLLKIPDTNLKIIVNPDDNELESIQAVLTHTVYWGYYYIVIIKEHRGDENIVKPKRKYFNTSVEYINELEKMYKANEEFLRVIPDKEMLKYYPGKEEFTDYESLIEHAIIHIYRHKTQIEKFERLIKENTDKNTDRK